MALKPTRSVVDERIEYYMFSTASPGGVVVATSGTGGWPVGTAMDTEARRAEYAATASGRVPLGVLTSTVVNIDTSRQRTNPYKDEVNIGGKVHIINKGRVVTNAIFAGEASGISMPASAYVGLSGNLYTTAGYNTASGYPLVGRFLTNVDSDGYATLEVNL